MANHPLFHPWIMSLLLLVTIKCLRNGFLTRTVFVFFTFSDVTQKLNITYLYAMVTSLCTTTPLQTSAFPNTSSPATVHTLVTCLSHHSLHHAHFLVNHIYIFILQEMFVASLNKTVKLLMHTYVSFSLGQKKQLSKQDWLPKLRWVSDARWFITWVKF